MTNKYKIKVGKYHIYMYSYLKEYKNGIILKQFKDVAFWIEPIREYMNIMGENTKLRQISTKYSVSKESIPEEYFYRYRPNMNRVLIEFNIEEDIKRVVAVNTSIRVPKWNSPWFMVDEMGTVCTCDPIGIPMFECKIHHMAIEGHSLICGCNGDPNWGLREPMDSSIIDSTNYIDEFPNYMPNQYPIENIGYKGISKFKVQEFEAKPVKRRKK